eukprot:CCRYP_010828-RA/>CCRYP_010828-RA protein AED:0.23 eAED:0.23 QI:70/1/1/1/0/0/2/0/77
MRSRSTHLESAKYRMSICHVLDVGFCTLAIAVHASLSSYSIVAACCGMPRSQSILLMNNIILPASVTAINSASVDDK